MIWCCIFSGRSTISETNRVWIWEDGDSDLAQMMMHSLRQKQAEVVHNIVFALLLVAPCLGLGVCCSLPLLVARCRCSRIKPPQNYKVETAKLQSQLQRMDLRRKSRSFVLVPTVWYDMIGVLIYGGRLTAYEWERRANQGGPMRSVLSTTKCQIVAKRVPNERSRWALSD